MAIIAGLARLAPALALVLVIAMSACDRMVIYSGADADAGAGAAIAAARRAFDDQVAPLLDGSCAACHAATAGVDFLAGDDRRGSVLAWPGLVDLATPRDSRLLTKAAHEGPAWTVEQSAEVRAWIDLEVLAAAEAGGGEALETAAFQPIAGMNAVDLGPVGRPGSRVDFRLEPIAVGWYLSEIAAHGGPGGAHLVHPLFVTWQGDVPQVDAIDRFAEVEVDVAEGASAPLGGGIAVLLGVAEGAALSVHFLEVGAARGDGGGLAGGCSAVAAFTASAQPSLVASCSGCHGGADPQAKSAVDMSALADLSPAGQAVACGQIRGRVNLTAPVDSGIFLAPDPASGVSHPFKLDQAAFEAFRASLLGWIEQEVSQ